MLLMSRTSFNRSLVETRVSVSFMRYQCTTMHLIVVNITGSLSLHCWEMSLLTYVHIVSRDLIVVSLIG